MLAVSALYEVLSLVSWEQTDGAMEYWSNVMTKNVRTIDLVMNASGLVIPAPAGI